MPKNIRISQNTNKMFPLCFNKISLFAFLVSSGLYICYFKLGPLLKRRMCSVCGEHVISVTH